MAIKYKVLAQKLEEYIYRNMEKGGTKLPTEAQICSRYQVSRQTVRQALMLLEEKGLIEKIHGSGSYFTGRKENNNKIAVILQGDQDYSYPKIRQTIELILQKAGFTCDFFSSEGSFLKEWEILKAMIEGKTTDDYRGLIIESANSGFPDLNGTLLSSFIKNNKKIVFLKRPAAVNINQPFVQNTVNTSLPSVQYAVNTSLPFAQHAVSTNLPFVQYDSLQENRLLLSELMSNGPQTIGCVLRGDDATDMNRFQQLVTLVRANQCQLTEESILFYNTAQLLELQDGKPSSEVKEKLQKLFRSCSCCICTNDEIAHFVLRDWKSTHDSLEDFRIAMYEQTFLYEDTYDLLSLIPAESSLAERAANLLLDSLRGYSPSSEELPVKLYLAEHNAL